MVLVPERVAVMVIRAWIEEESDSPELRARLTEIDKLVGRHVESRVIVSADVDEISEEVRRWLARFLAARDGTS